MKRLVTYLANSETQFINLLRISIFIVMAWIGGLKVYQYEADGIVPFVANSPLMSFFYDKQAPEYRDYKNPEGKTVQKNIDWHKENEKENNADQTRLVDNKNYLDWIVEKTL